MAAAKCSCARHADGSVTTSLCPLHAETDPCLTMARVTGTRRKGTIRRGVCTACGHGARPDPIVAKAAERRADGMTRMIAKVRADLAREATR